MRLVFKFLLLIVLGFQISCSDSEKGKNSVVDSFSFEGTDYASLVDRINSIDLRDNLDQILSANPERFANQIESAIDNARSGVLLVSKFGSDQEKLQDAFDILSTAIGQYESYGILEFEQYSFEEIFNDVRVLRASIAKKLNIADDYTWVLTNHNFADGIEPYFTSFPGKDSRGNLVRWVENFQIDLPKAQVQGREAFAWIVSQPFSLKGIKSPAFRYFSQYNVAFPDSLDTPLKETIEKNFQTYLILDQLPGENPEGIEDSRKKHITYDTNDIPMGRDFHGDWLPLVSLEEYKGHKVSIAFLYDTRKVKEKQYYSWSIRDFELWGSGLLRKPASIYSPNLDDNLGGFKSLSYPFRGNKWGKYKKGLKVLSGSSKTDSLLLSPKFAVPEDVETVKVSFVESLKGLGETSAELVISTNYKGGVDPEDGSVEWVALNAKYELDVEKRQVSYDLKNYKGKEIILGFRFKSPAGADAFWEITNFFLESEGPDLTKVPYSVPDLDARFRLALYDMISPDFRKFSLIYEDKEQSPRWSKKSDGSIISGFRKKQYAATRVVFPETDLSGSSENVLRINQAMKHMNNQEALKVQIRLSCKGIENCENLWSDFVFPAGTFEKFVDDITLSAWVDIPAEFQGQKVETSILYKAKNGNTPEWKVRWVEIGGIK